MTSTTRQPRTESEVGTGMTWPRFFTRTCLDLQIAGHRVRRGPVVVADDAGVNDEFGEEVFLQELLGQRGAAVQAQGCVRLTRVALEPGSLRAGRRPRS